MRKKLLGILLSFIMVIGVVACSSPSPQKDHMEQLKKALEDDGYKVKDILYDQDQQEEFTFDISDRAKRRVDEDEAFQVYTDMEFEHVLNANVTFEDNKAIISAPNQKEEAKADKKDINLKKRKEWGSFAYYFIVQEYDLETGSSLRKPEVTIFSVEQPLTTPELEVSYSKDGGYTITWEKAEDAKEYMFFDEEHKDGEVTYTYLGSVKGNEYNSKDAKFKIPPIESGLFQTYDKSEDAYNEVEADIWWDEEEQFANIHRLHVMAKNGDETSNLSYQTTIKEKDKSKDAKICDSAPIAQAERGLTTLETIEQIPASIPVTSCDGETVYHKIIVDDKGAEKDEQGMLVPYSVENSSVTGSFRVTNISEDYKKQLKDRKSSIDKEKVKQSDYTYIKDITTPYNLVVSDEMQKVDYPIHGDTEFEQFISSNLVYGAQMIDISNFDESNDYEYVYDVVFQEILQSYYALEVYYWEYDFDEGCIYIEYGEGREVRKEKQRQIYEKVKQVSSEIITPDMEEPEKVYAINAYVTAQTEYNHAAAEVQGEERKPYYESQSASGVFLNGVAVCEGYAAAVNMLVDYNGMESVLVTGYAQGESNGRHAWSRIKIGDGWYLVDSTFNDEIENTYLLLPDEIANDLYTPDEYYVIDDNLDNFSGSGMQYEYFTRKGLSMDTAAATTYMIQNLRAQGKISLRVPMGTTQADAKRIAEAVVPAISHGVYYGVQDGVLYMELD